MVKRSEICEFGGAWLHGDGLSVGSEVLARSSRVRKAAWSLASQPEKPVVAGYGAAKTAPSTTVGRRSKTSAQCARK